MSRVFTKNTSNYMSLGVGGLGSLINGAAAVSVHVWARYATLSTAANNNAIVTVNINGAATTGLLLSAHNGTSAVLRAGARSLTADAFQAANGTTVLSSATYYSLGAVYNFTADTITPYVNGTAEGGASVTFGSNTFTLGTPSAAECIGATFAPPGSVVSQWDGELEALAIWNTALSGADFTNLAAGAWPGAIATANLVSLHILAGYDSPEPNLVSGGPSGTITGTVAAGSNNPTLWRPWYGDIGLLVGSA